MSNFFSLLAQLDYMFSDYLTRMSKSDDAYAHNENEIKQQQTLHIQ